MSPLARITLSASALIVVFDVLASLASRHFGFPYLAAAPGSFLIYVATGFAVGRVYEVPQAVGVAAVVGEVEATIGWWLSSMIGGGPRLPVTTATEFARTVVAVVVVAGTIGAAGGWLGRSYGRRRPKA